MRRQPDSPLVTDSPGALLERALFEVKRVIVGQDRMVERMLVCLLARGHCLLEGVPGVAKTLAVQTMATVVGGSFARLQFTPDLVPSNRAPAKVQSALLEVMAERHVSIGGVTYPVPDPFLVLATQNPIESEGVYPLPEAQRDRFLMKVQVPYPSELEEMEIVRRMGVRPPQASQVLDADVLRELQDAATDVFVHHAIAQYAVRLVLATRSPAGYGLGSLAGQLAYGASPRASLGLVAAARALALVRGRDYVVPHDVADLVADVIPHRLVLSYDALADGTTPDAVAAAVVAGIEPPRVAPSQLDAG